ncbi:TPA: HypC/HybG/HupF family hydrogenase formation chaperone [Photobacterium damselae]
MCLCIPSSVIELYPDETAALVETIGVQRKVSTHLIAEPIELGDHLLVHVGFAISKINAKEAQESLEMYKLILADMERQELEGLV